MTTATGAVIAEIADANRGTTVARVVAPGGGQGLEYLLVDRLDPSSATAM